MCSIMRARHSIVSVMHHFSIVGRSRSKDLLPRGQHLVFTCGWRWGSLRRYCQNYEQQYLRITLVPYFTYKHNWIINLTLIVEKSSYLLLLRLIRYFGFMWELKMLPQCKKFSYQNSYVFWNIQFSTVMITCGLFALQIGALIPSPHCW